MAVFFPWWCTDVVYIDRRCKSLWRSLILRLGGHLNPYEIAMMETTTGLLGCICKMIQMCRWMFSPGWVWQVVGMNRFAALLISLCFWKLTAGKRKLCFALLLDVIQSIPAFSSMSKKSNYIKNHTSQKCWHVNDYESLWKRIDPTSLTESYEYWTILLIC